MSADRAETLDSLAAAIRRAGLGAPAALLLDALAPLDVIASQLALLGRPLLGGSPYDVYAAALADAESWKELRRLLGRQ
jgi:hypothetical protein